MTTQVLGKYSFLDIPDVNGSDVLLNGGGVPTILAGAVTALPAAGTTGRLYLDTTNSVFYRDNGTSWDNMTALVQLTGTPNQISITPAVVGTPANIALATNPTLPGLQKVTIPGGATTDRPASPVAGDFRYNSTITKHEGYNGSYWIPFGNVIQAVTGLIPASSGTTTVPLDNTIPTSTEGWQVFSNTVTPISASSKMLIIFSITCSMSATGTMIGSVFAGTTNIGSAAVLRPATNVGSQMTFSVLHQPGSTSPITYSFRFGGSAASTTYVNQIGTTTLGGALASNYTILEIL
jgi:hypothetical protein